MRNLAIKQIVVWFVLAILPASPIAYVFGLKGDWGVTFVGMFIVIGVAATLSWAIVTSKTAWWRWGLFVLWFIVFLWGWLTLLGPYVFDLLGYQ